MSKDSQECIFSRESGDGTMPCDSPDSPQTDLFGQPLAPALRSRLSAPAASRDREGARTADRRGILCGTLDELASRYASSAAANGRPTPGTYGRRYGDSRRSDALHSSTESRLKAMLAGSGLPESGHHWKSWVTLLGRPACLLVASAPHIFARDCGGRRVLAWPTVVAEDSKKVSPGEGDRRVARDRRLHMRDMGDVVMGWATATAHDWRDGPEHLVFGANPDGSARVRMDRLPMQAFSTHPGWSGLPSNAAIPVEDRASTDLPRFNPLFAGWEMGYPDAWTLSFPGFRQSVAPLAKSTRESTCGESSGDTETP